MSIHQISRVCGPALDWAAATVMGLEPRIVRNWNKVPYIQARGFLGTNYADFSPQTIDKRVIVDLIQYKRMCIQAPEKASAFPLWAAFIFIPNPDSGAIETCYRQVGGDVSNAVLRCYIDSVQGVTIDIPDELVEYCI